MEAGAGGTGDDDGTEGLLRTRTTAWDERDRAPAVHRARRSVAFADNLPAASVRCITPAACRRGGRRTSGARAADAPDHVADVVGHQQRAAVRSDRHTD